MKNTMEFDLVKEMVNNYRNNQLNWILTAPTSNLAMDASAIWFDLATLKNFISSIEEAIALNPDLPTDNVGIRMYYAAYPPIEKWSQPGYEDIADLLDSDETKKYEKLHTLVLVPTTEINAVNTDFNPLDATTYEAGFPTAGPTAVMALTYKGTIAAKNHGRLYPPGDITGEAF
jgi:hypothetical protein